MTSEIQIGIYKPIKPSSVKWKCSVGSMVDTCKIQLPLITFTKNYSTPVVHPNGSVELKMGGLESILFEGDKVSIKLGYDGNNNLVFSGFINRVNYSVPMEIECEGYTYQIKNKVFTKSYGSTTVKKILQDLTQGTDVKLSEHIPDIPLSGVTFRNTPGLKVLEWFQKECLLAVYFDFETLYVGVSTQAIQKPAQTLELGWNVIEDKAFKKDVSVKDTQINIIEKTTKGETKKTKGEQKKYSNTKEVKIRTGISGGIKTQIQKELQRLEDNKGYNGSITCFLEPYFQKGYVAQIRSNRFPDKNGMYFVDTIEGSFDSSGGRQKLTLTKYGN